MTMALTGIEGRQSRRDTFLLHLEPATKLLRPVGSRNFEQPGNPAARHLVPALVELPAAGCVSAEK